MVYKDKGKKRNFEEMSIDQFRVKGKNWRHNFLFNPVIGNYRDTTDQ